MDIQNTQTMLKMEKDQSSRAEQKTFTPLSQEDIARISKQEVKIYEEAEDFLLDLNSQAPDGFFPTDM